MVCNQMVDGMAVQTLTTKTLPFGPSLKDVRWVRRVEVWFSQYAEGVDHTEFRVFDKQRRFGWRGIVESRCPKGRRFWGNHHGCVAGRETLGVTLLTRHCLSRQQFPGVQPDYALTLPGGERDGDTCGFHTSDPNTTVLDVRSGR